MTYIGQEIPSLTNTKLVAGKGTFVDDISLPGTAHAAVLRSPYRACTHPLDRHRARPRASPGVRLRRHRERGQGADEPDPGDLRHGRGRSKGRRSGTPSASTGRAMSARRSPRSSPRTGHRLRGARPDRCRLRGAARRADPEEAMQPGGAARRARVGRQHHGRAATSGSATRTPRSRRPTARSAATSVGPDHRHCDRAPRVPRHATTPTTT